MTRERDPLGKRALFSQAAAPADRKNGPFDVSVHCSSCDERTTLSAPDLLIRGLPLWAWLPWRKHSLFMRCPACDRVTWLAVSRPT